MDAWLKQLDRARGQTLSLQTMLELGIRWFGDRLSPEFRSRGRAEAQACLDAQGLHGSFWQLDP